MTRTVFKIPAGNLQMSGCQDPSVHEVEIETIAIWRLSKTYPCLNELYYKGIKGYVQYVIPVIKQQKFLFALVFHSK